MRRRGRDLVYQGLCGQPSPGLVGHQQSAPASAPVALGTNFIWRSGVHARVPVLVDLMQEILRCAGPQATAKGPRTLQISPTLVPLDSGAGCARITGGRERKTT